MVLPKEKILESHKQIYRHMKSRARQYDEYLSKDLKAYKKDQKKFSNRDFQDSDIDELLGSVESSRVVYLGDFHTFDQNSRNLERILRAVARMNKKVILAMEMVHVENQHCVEGLQKGVITEKEFLEEIHYQDSWRFPWRHYKKFFQDARKGKYEILALNSHGTLPQRDDKAARILADKLEGDKEVSILVLFGELHILPDKLPAGVRQYFGKELQQTIIHQNLDKVHWKLIQEKGHVDETNQIVKFDEGEFALQTSPPWVKYESMIYWYENLSDDPDFDVHDAIMEDSLTWISDSNSENFLYLCERINETLPLPSLERDVLEDFQIYEPHRLDFVLELVQETCGSFQRKLIEELISKGDLVHIPGSNRYYLSHHSVNRLSSMAGLHVYLNYLKSMEGVLEEVETSRDKKKRFVFYCYRHIFTYLSSKIFNPYRKCDLYLDIYEKSKTALPKAVKKKYYIILEIFELKEVISENLASILTGHGEADIYSAAKCLGYMIADKMISLDYFDGDTGQPVVELLGETTFSPMSLEKIMGFVFPGGDYKKMRKRFF